MEGDLRNKSSFSTTRESGYGRSIEEDNVEIPLVVTVSEIRAKMVFKIFLESENRSWLVHRRQLEFLHLQDSLKNENHLQIGPEIPLHKRASERVLNEFMQNLIIDSNAMQLQICRQFLQLDPVVPPSLPGNITNLSYTHSSTVILNPLGLGSNTNSKLPPPIPPRASKPKLENNLNCDTTNDVPVPISKIPLGCEEKRQVLHFSCMNFIN